MERYTPNRVWLLHFWCNFMCLACRIELLRVLFFSSFSKKMFTALQWLLFNRWPVPYIYHGERDRWTERERESLKLALTKREKDLRCDGRRRNCSIVIQSLRLYKYTTLTWLNSYLYWIHTRSQMHHPDIPVTLMKFLNSFFSRTIYSQLP